MSFGGFTPGPSIAPGPQAVMGECSACFIRYALQLFHFFSLNNQVASLPRGTQIIFPCTFYTYLFSNYLLGYFPGLPSHTAHD